MGMFDCIKCDYKEMPKEHRVHRYQTKDLVNAMDLYVIDEEGNIFYENYEIEDQSDPEAEGIMRMAGCMTKVNKRLEPMECFTDTVVFYHYDDKTHEEVEYKAQFTKGKITYFEELKND